MKKLTVIILTLFVLIACSKDEDTDPTVAICQTPSNFTTINVTDSTAELSWENTNTNASFKIEYGISGFTQGTGNIITITVNQNAFTLTGLLANTSYEVYIKAICTSTNQSMPTNALSFTTAPPRPIAELLPNLTDLNLFAGDLKELIPSPYGFTYALNSGLFSDYAHKERFIVLPEGETMTAQGNLMPDFPDNTIIVKTFYFNNNETDLSQGRRIVETRLLIKQNGSWVTGDYHWNTAQTEAVLDVNAEIVPITFINEAGTTLNINYEIPSNLDCTTCHKNNNQTLPLGPKLRSINFNNQLQDLIANNRITGLTDVTTIPTLPNWQDDMTYTLEERARAYMDVNCSSCHQPGGHCDVQTTLDFRLETAFANTSIFEKKSEINSRMANYQELFSMPLLGTTFVHTEGYFLIKAYLNTL
ncbi:MAG: fibronectin type III domain-containing protein [Olleya sp.]